MENIDVNMAESRNFLPYKKEFLRYITYYKTCDHSEHFQGRPGLWQMEKITKTFTIENYIHESDLNKSYKTRLIDHLKNTNRVNHLSSVSKHVRNCHDIPSWFHDILPPDPEHLGGDDVLIEVQEQDQHCKVDCPIVDQKQYTCDKCEFNTDHYGSLTNHYRRKHGRKVPKRLCIEICPHCNLEFKELQNHNCKTVRRHVGS